MEGKEGGREGGIGRKCKRARHETRFIRREEGTSMPRAVEGIKGQSEMEVIPLQNLIGMTTKSAGNEERDVLIAKGSYFPLTFARYSRVASSMHTTAQHTVVTEKIACVPNLLPVSPCLWEIE